MVCERLRSYKRSKYWNLHETGASYKTKYLYTNNCGQNLWNNVLESSKIGQEEKTLTSVFE